MSWIQCSKCGKIVDYSSTSEYSSVSITNETSIYLCQKCFDAVVTKDLNTSEVTN